ncbi:MAG: hypothetical protein R3D85_07995 [Paracoccaceae bacterium]
MLHDGSGMGALAGTMAVLMAAQGFTGAPAITAEGEDAAPFWADLGQDWTIERNYIKPYPICRWAHGALEALEQLIAAHDLRPDRIARVEVATFANSAALYRGVPESSAVAQYALTFPLAVLLVHRAIGPDHVSGEGLRDPAVLALMPRIHIREEPRHTDRYPAGRWSDVTVTLDDGTVVQSGDCNARGGPEAPLTLDQVEAKFRVMTAHLSPERRDALWAMRARLLQPEARFAELADLVGPAA